MSRNREKKKIIIAAEENAQNKIQNSVEIQNSEESSSASKDTTMGPLIVKLPTITPKKRSRTRISRSTSISRRKIRKLEEQNQQLNRKYKTISKRYERLMKRTTQHKDTEQSISESDDGSDKLDKREGSTISSKLTPRKRSLQELRDEGISPTKIPKVIKDKLILANTLTDEIAEAYRSSNEQGKGIVVDIISGERLKKYRLKKTLSSATRINRATLYKKEHQRTSTVLVKEQEMKKPWKMSNEMSIHSLAEMTIVVSCLARMTKSRQKEFISRNEF